MVYSELFSSKSASGEAWGYSLCCSFWTGYVSYKLPPGVEFYARGVYFWYVAWDDSSYYIDFLSGRLVMQQMSYERSFDLWVTSEWASLHEVSGDVQYWSDVAVLIGFVQSFAESSRFGKVLVMIDKLLTTLGLFED